MAEYISRDAIDKWIVDSLAQYGNRYTTDQLNMFGLFRTVINDHSLFPAADVVERKKGEWDIIDKSMRIDLENAREQYRVLGYPHRTYLHMQCSKCRKVTMVDSSIAYEFCPHCGAEMRQGADDVQV